MCDKIKCPNCGNEIEFYTKERYKGICDVYFRTDGKVAYNAEMYDYAEYSYRSKFIFCGVCDAKVDKVEVHQDKIKEYMCCL